MYFWWYWDDYQIWKKLFFTKGGYKKNLNQDGWNLKRNYGLLDKRWPKMMHWIFQIFGWSYSSIMAKNQAKFFLTKLFIWGFTGKNPLKWTCSEEMEAWHSAISREILEFVNWFGCPKSEPKKLSSILPKCFFFFKRIINSFLCEIYHKLDILNAYLWVKYSMVEEKPLGFMNTCSSYLGPDAPFFQYDRWPFKTT